MRWIVVTFVFLMMIPVVAMAQNATLPTRGDILELRSDDARCPEGFRCFIAGRGASYEQMLERVNGDIEDASLHVTLTEFETANPCRLIYRRPSGAMSRNGSCPSQNGTSEPVTWRRFCESGSCSRWTIATTDLGYATVYRVPAERQLTPGERAEEMVHVLDSREIEETVPAPATLGGQLTELADLMGETQPPTYRQTQDVIRSMGHALTRASSVTTHEMRTPNTYRVSDGVSNTEESPASAGVDSQDEASMTHAGVVEHETSISARKNGVRPAPFYTNLLLIGLMLLVGVLGYLLVKAKKEQRAQRALLDRQCRDLQEAELDHSLRIAWKDAKLYGQPTPLLINQMARAHALLERVKRHDSAWSPAYGDIHEHLEEVLEEVGEARSLRQVVREALPGTDVHSPEKVREAIQRELKHGKEKVRENQVLDREIPELKRNMAEAYIALNVFEARIQKMKVHERDLSTGLELLREDAARKAQRIETLERELEMLEPLKSLEPGEQLLEHTLSVVCSAQLHFNAVLDIFSQHDLVQDDGSVHLRGKKSYEVGQILSALYGALMSLEGDLDQLHARVLPDASVKEIERVSTQPFVKYDPDAQTVVSVHPGAHGKSNGSSGRSPHPRTLPPPGLFPSED